MSRCEDEQMWRWADVKMRRCERRVREGVKMRRCEDEKVRRWEGVKMRRCEEQMWRWADVKMSRCEDEQMWRWADVKMRRCEDEKVWRWEGVKMRCEEEQMWRWEGVKMRRWEDVREGVKMRRWDTDPHYWKNPALRRSREKDKEEVQSCFESSLHLLGWAFGNCPLAVKLHHWVPSEHEHNQDVSLSKHSTTFAAEVPTSQAVFSENWSQILFHQALCSSLNFYCIIGRNVWVQNSRPPVESKSSTCTMNTCPSHFARQG